MPFRYKAIITRPSTDTQFFHEKYPEQYEALINWWRAQPGFIEGTWAVNPDVPTQFIAEHTWDNRLQWQLAAIASKDLETTRLMLVNGIQTGLSSVKTLSDF